MCHFLVPFDDFVLLTICDVNESIYLVESTLLYKHSLNTAKKCKHYTLVFSVLIESFYHKNVDWKIVMFTFL